MVFNGVKCHTIPYMHEVKFLVSIPSCSTLVNSDGALVPPISHLSETYENANEILIIIWI
jgi:hypothetical protein